MRSNNTQIRQPYGWRLARQAAAPVLALSVGAALIWTPGPGTPAGPAVADGWTPMTPVLVNYEMPADRARTVSGNLLGFNDFHGAIDPPSGSGGLVNGVPAGGVEYLTSTVKRLRAEAQSERRTSFTVGAGDMIGASPLVSAAFHDEPSIELLNNLGLQITSVGNHEFDEGVTELLRMQRGGCHPVDGCQDDDGFGGAKFDYLAANVVSKRTGLPVLPPISLRRVDGVVVGFVGMTLEGTPNIVNPSGISTVAFKDEIETANRVAAVLRMLGVRSLVLLLHEGGQQQVTAPALPDVSSCANFSGAVAPIVAQLRPEYGIVVTGHTHLFYSCALPNALGTPTVVTSAGVNGQLVTDIDFTLDRRTGAFASIAARNVIVENGVRNPDGSWQVTSAGVPVRNAALVDESARQIADKYRLAITPIANRVVGAITADISRTALPNGQSPLGDVVADGQLAWTRGLGAQIAFANLGGLRSNLTYAFSPGGEALGAVTYGECFTAQPFNNFVVLLTYTGAQLNEVLEQQFNGYQGQFRDRFLQVSAGFTYSYDSRLPLGARISDMRLNGVAIDPAATYRVATSNFLADGGDAMTKLSVGADRIAAPGFDVDALVAYLGAGAPVAPGLANRVTKLG